ncbi:MAG: hypothetical protein ACLUNO_02135 [Oscillospiraceae bacterium]
MEQSMNRYIGQMLDNRYEILEIIGSGGMSVVYKAMCHKLHRYVAVKILRDEMAEDAELKTAFRRRHTPSPCSRSRISSRSTMSATAGRRSISSWSSSRA